jgi:hypothetical protein
MDGINEFIGSPVSLDPSKNNSETDIRNGDRELKRCPQSRTKVEFVLHGEGGDILRSAYVRCKKWACEFCGKQNAIILRKRINQGFSGLLTAHSINPAHFQYAVKLLTLTVPGQEWRNCRTTEEASVLIKKSLKKFLDALRNRFAPIDYLWVDEKQRDGFPHIHLLLVGRKIAPREVLDWARALWRDRYGMGEIDIRAVKSIHQVTNYLVKYVTKGMETGAKGYRVFSMSACFRTFSNLEKPNITLLRIWNVDEIDGEEVLTLKWEKEGYPWGEEQEQIKRNLQELIDFFDYESRPKQIELNIA